jgi:hypothetical protein
MIKKTSVFFLKTILPLGLGIYLFWYFFSAMSEQSKKLFFQALSQADYRWIFLSLLIAIASYFSRAYRWKYALEPMGYKTNSTNRFHALMIGYLVNLTLPRAGEASRAMVINRSDGVPFTIGFGTIISERIVDIFFLATITFTALLLGKDDFFKIKSLIEAQFGSDSSQNSGFIYYVILIILVFGIIALLFQKIRIKVFRIAKELFQSTISIFRTKNPVAYIAHSFFIWICFLLMFLLPFYSLESTKDLPISCVLFSFIAGSVGISLTNGGIGSYPLLVGLVVGFYLTDLPREEAFAIGNALGLLIWVSQTVLLVLIGLISWIIVPKTTINNEQI